jgi:uncharacterized protein YbcI
MVESLRSMEGDALTKGQAEAKISEVVDVELINTHSDVSTKTGEKIMVITVGENLEEKLLG